MLRFEDSDENIMICERLPKDFGYSIWIGNQDDAEIHLSYDQFSELVRYLNDEFADMAMEL